MESLTIQYAGKVNNMLDILKSMQAGMSAEKLHMTISHDKTKKKTVLHAPRDRFQGPMGWSWHDVIVGSLLVWQSPLKWGTSHIVIL